MNALPKLLLLLPFFWAFRSNCSEICKVQDPVPSTSIKICASSEFRGSEAIFAINGSGMTRHFHQSDNLGKNMWLSGISEKSVQARPGTKNGIVWLLVEFDKTRKIESFEIWNYNQDNHTNRGLRKVYFQYSNNGTDWQSLKNGKDDFFILPKARGRKLEPSNFMLHLKGVEFKYFCITADSDEGNYYHDHLQTTLRDAKEKNQNINYYGLSEIRFFEMKKLNADKLVKVSSFDLEAFPAYQKTSQGPAREYKISFDNPLYCGGNIKITCDGKFISQQIPVSEKGLFELSGLFPVGYMENNMVVTIHLTSAQGKITKAFTIEPARKWTLYFLPHSHLDIGYTHSNVDVLALQIRNFKQAMDLIECTKNYPEGSRFKWNVETLWPLTEWIKQEKNSGYFRRFTEYVRRGDIGLNASLGSILTGISKQEELMHLCDDAPMIEKETGTKIRSVMMSDVPGLSWGTVTGLAQNGIKYLSMAPNYVPFLPTGGSRVGYVHREWGDYPFYWESQSGNDKVLYWSSGKGYSMFHDWLSGKLSASGLNPIWEYLKELEEKRFPYDISYLRYTVNGDNGPPDSLMSDIIREWNKIYEFPKFKIGTSDEVFSELEGKYGSTIPSFKGDFTPYWEEGAASTAAELSLNRRNSDRLGQLEILWSMVRPGSFPFDTFYKSWRNVVLFSEHTWGASASYSDYQSEHTKKLWNEKRSFAMEADSLTRQLSDPGFKPADLQNNYISVFNTCAWPRTDVVKISSNKNLGSMILEDENGIQTELQQMTSDDWIFIARDVPALSSKVYRLKTHTPYLKSYTPDLILKATTTQLSNGIISLTLDPNRGTIQSLSSNGDDYNYASGSGLNEYLYSGTNLSGLSRVELLDSVQIFHQGPAALTLRAYSKAPGCNSLIQEYTLYRGLNRVDIKNYLDKKEVYSGENVRFCFPFNIPNSETGIDLAFSKMRPEREQLDGSNKNFFCMNNGVSVEGQKYSMLLASTSAPILEIGQPTGEQWMKDRKEFFGWEMATKSSPVIYSWVMNNSWHTNYKATQSGKVDFSYSLVPLKPYDDQAKKKAFELAQPLMAFFTGSSLPVQSEISISGSDMVAVSVMHPSKDGSSMFVRLINLSEKPVKCSILSRKNAVTAKECDNNENFIRDADSSSLWFKPYATVNLLLKY
jgi:hypothetical protein